MTSTATTAALDARQRGVLRRRLLADRDATLASSAQLGLDVDAVRHSRRDSSTDDEHDPEGATLAFEQSQSSALLVQTARRLFDIDAALARLDTAGLWNVLRVRRPDRIRAPDRAPVHPALCHLRSASREMKEKDMSDPKDLTDGTLPDDADLDSDSSLAEKVATADSMESSRSTEAADGRMTEDEIDRSERHD